MSTMKVDSVINAAGTGPFQATNGALVPIVAKTTTYAATTNDEVILADATSASFTITLPAANTAGKVLCITKSDATANTVTIARAGSDTIAGVTSRIIKTRYAQLRLVSDGTSTWYVLGDTTAQTVQTYLTTPYTNTSAIQTVQDITGLAASITPSSTATKILVQVALQLGCATAGAAGVYLKRGGSLLTAAGGTVVGSRPGVSAGMAAQINADQQPLAVTIEYLDSPASVSSLTYQVSVASFFSPNIYVNQSINDSNDANHARSASSITLTELNYQ